MIQQFVCNSYSDKLKLLLCLLVETFLNVLGCWEVIFEEREGCLVEKKLPVGKERDCLDPEVRQVWCGL